MCMCSDLSAELVPHGRGLDVKRPCVYSTTLVIIHSFIHSLSLSRTPAQIHTLVGAQTYARWERRQELCLSHGPIDIFISLYIYISWSQSLGHFPTTAHSLCSRTGLILHFTPLPAVQTSLPFLPYRLHSPFSRTENIQLAGASVHLLARPFYRFRE